MSDFGKHRTWWVLRPLACQYGSAQRAHLGDYTSDMTASPGDLPEQPLLQRQSHAMPDLGRGWEGRVTGLRRASVRLPTLGMASLTA